MYDNAHFRRTGRNKIDLSGVSSVDDVSCAVVHIMPDAVPICPLLGFRMCSSSFAVL